MEEVADLLDLIIQLLYDKSISEPEQEVFNHMVTTNDGINSPSFTAFLEDVASEHTVTENTPKRFGNVFQIYYWILVLQRVVLLGARNTWPIAPLHTRTLKLTLLERHHVISV